jgi:transcriptional regulator with XRE-family HTH domain
MLLNAKFFREQKNYSIDYVAIELDISKKKYLKIENGLKEIKLSELQKLSKILGVKKSELLNLDKKINLPVLI